MADNAQKTPFVTSINDAAMAKARAAIQVLGKNLPCSVVRVQGAIVRVKFEVVAGVLPLPQVTMPLFGPEYIRYPIQVGDRGVAMSADAYLGGVSGLGGGTADLTTRNNLAALVFFPVGNANWTTVDPNAVIVYGPNGVVLRDQASNSIITLTPSQIVMTRGATSVIINNAGVEIIGNLTVTGNMIGGSGGADQVNLQTHVHTGVQGGAGTTAAPRPGS